MRNLVTTITLVLGFFMSAMAQLPEPTVLVNRAPQNKNIHVNGPVSFCSELEGYAFSMQTAAGPGSVVKTIDGGKTWNATSLQWPNPFSTPYSSFGNGMQIQNPQTNLVYANEFKSTDGGASWRQVITGASQVVFFNAFTGLAIKGQKLLRTTDGGSNWTVLNESQNFSGYRISFRNSSNRILLFNLNTFRRVLVSNNGGLSFSSHQIPDVHPYLFSNEVVEIKFFDSDRGVALLGGNFDNAGHVFTISDGGTTWTRYMGACPSAMRTFNALCSVFPSGTGYVNGMNFGCTPSNFKIFKTTNFGVSWFASESTNASEHFISAFDETKLVRKGGSKSTDGGITWSANHFPYTLGTKCSIEHGDFAYGAFFVAGDQNQRIVRAVSGCDVGETPVNYTLKTTNNGASWFEYEASFSGSFTPAAHFGVDPPIKTANGNQYLFKGNNGFKLNSNGLYRSTNFGETWVLFSSLVKLNPWYFNTQISETACLFFNPTESELMQVETSSGSTVRTTATKTDGGILPVLSQISFSDENNGIGFHGFTLFKTTDGGKTWAEMGNLPASFTQGSFNLIGPGKLGDGGQFFFFSRKRLSQASAREGNNTIYKLEVPGSLTPVLQVTVAQIIGTSTSETSNSIMSLDMVGGKGVVSTCGGALYETENNWASIRQVTASDFCQTFGIPRPVKSIQMGSFVQHYALNAFDYLAQYHLASFRSGEKIGSGFFDRDEDGFRGTGVVYNNFSPPSSPTLLQIGSFQDCDDDEPTISPVAPDNICNGVDNNCNGTVDEGATFVSYYQDMDGDGFGDPTTMEQFCSNPGGFWVTNSLDCNDADLLIGLPLRWNLDADGDGYGNPAVFVISCENPSNAFETFVRNNGDCNDDNPLEFNSIWFLDADQDGFGTESVEAGMEPANVVFSCSNPSTDEIKYVRNRRDCDDNNPLISPRQWEVAMDGIDNDCDGFIDEGTDPPGTTYCDLDGDDFGHPGCPIFPGESRTFNKDGINVVVTFEQGVANNTDCDDNDPLINPASFEFSNGKDNDCNGLVDDTLETNFQVWYLDADGDGYGYDQQTLISDIPPQGYVAISGDCDDSNPNVFPNANEICGNGIDENCNGQIDENNPLVNAGQDQTIAANTGNIQLTGTPAGGSWSGTGVSSSGSFNTNQTPGAYTLTYSITAPCPASDQVVITLLPNNPGTTLARPTYSPQAGTYSGPQLVTLSSSDPLATIYYTLSGNTPLLNPWPNSFTRIYTGPVQIVKNTQIRAIAVRAGFSNSSVAVANFTILEGLVVENPVITPGTGSYNGAQLVSISTQTAGSTIYYTTNGNNPLLTTPNSFTKLYEGPFLVNQTTNVKAMAIKAGLQNSGVSSVFLTISDPPICAAPVISPGSGTYSGAQTVTMTTATSGATILYTTNGNIPAEGTSFTKIYSQPFIVNSNTTIRAIAIKEGFEKSTCPRADLVITTPTQTVATPVISPGTGSYSNAQLVAITCSTPGATIYYTTNGNVPRLDVPNSFTKIYTNPFNVSTSATIRAIATAPGFINSSSTVAFLTINSGARKAVVDKKAAQGSTFDFVLLPNPTTGHFQILEKSGKSEESRLVEIFSSTGKRVYSKRWEGKSTAYEVDMMGMPAGIYSVRIVGNSGHAVLRFHLQ